MVFTLTGYDVGEVVWSDAHSTVYSAVRQESKTAVLLRVLKEQNSPSDQLGILKRDFDIATDVKSPKIVKPLTLEQTDGTEVLILEDCGARPLKHFMPDQPLDVDRCLDIACQMATAVLHVHRHGVIHNNINAESVLFDPETDNVALTDFSLASRLRDGPPTSSTHTIHGRLPYISPEQTGRMNRVIDHRSDHYSLGVVMYRLLTGRLPFETVDPLELVHCHLARRAPPPHTIADHIPVIVSDIVMKLIAKTPEERYQGAQGLLTDLEACLGQLRSHGVINDVIAGANDVFENVQVSQRIFGRDEELNVLLGCFERVSGGTCELVLVAGQPGIGKSALVNEIQKPIVERHGYFISGKCDQYKRNIPYSSIVQAFQELSRQLLSDTKSNIAFWAGEITNALGRNTSLIVDVIPEIEYITGKQPPAPDLPPTERGHRFNKVFRDFIRVFARPEHPLTLFLDDLQWADPGSLSLLRNLIIDKTTQYLLVIGAYRDTEVRPGHTLVRTLTELRQAEVAISEITLPLLSADHVNDVAADTFHCDRDWSVGLAELLYVKTGGNPFFVNQLIHFLLDEKLITYDHGLAKWRWDLRGIHERGVTDDVVEFMIAKLRRLPEDTQTTLKVASCIGSTFDLRTLALVMEAQGADPPIALQVALQEGLILTSTDPFKLWDNPAEWTSQSGARNVRFRFLHDRVQQASLALVPEDEQLRIHLLVGTLLQQHLSPRELEDQLFSVLNHLNQSADLITDQRERDQIAVLNLKAGRKARASTAYEDANQYLAAGIDLLSNEAWDSQYRLAFDLHAERFECEYLSGSFDRANRIFDILQDRAQTTLERAQIYNTKVVLDTSADQADKAISMGIQALKLFGIKLPRKTRVTDVLWDLAQARLLVAGKSQETLMNLPVLADSSRQTTMRLLMNIGPAAYFENPDLMVHAALKIVTGTVRHGNSPVSAFGYVIYGLVMCAQFHKYQTGHEFGRLAVSLSERFDDVGIRCRVKFIFAAFINFWSQPIHTTLKLLKESFDIAVEAGDLEYANYAITQTLFCKTAAGTNLDDIVSTYDRNVTFVDQSGHAYSITQVTVRRQMLFALQGKTRAGHEMTSDDFDEQSMVEAIRQTGNLTSLSYYFIAKLQLAYLFEDYETALRVGLESDGQIKGVLGQILAAEHYFYLGLTTAAILKSGSSDAGKLRRVLKKCRRNMKRFATGCAENFQAKALLLEAEAAGVGGRSAAAAAAGLYDEAIELATQHGLTNIEALGNELVGSHYLKTGRKKVGEAYIQAATQAYKRWGARAKLNQMRKRYGDLMPSLDKETKEYSREAIEVTSTTGDGMLDLETVMKAAHAISGEIVFERLLDKLIRIVIENAGAQRGVFILADKAGLRIEAMGSVESPEVAVLNSIPIETSPDVCAPMVQYVARTHTDVLLDDARKDPRFGGSTYVRERQPKSILCSPVLKQGKLVGVLYAENNLATGAFTQSRMQMIRVIASEVAIAIENARLYGDLQENVEDLQDALGKIDLLEKAKVHLSKFVPHSVQQIIEQNPEAPALEKREADVSILFLDIAGYTRMSEDLDREKLDHLIERYFSSFLDDINANNGDINETAGDGLMIMFQDPEPTTNAAQAAMTALAIRKKTEQINKELQGAHEPVVVNIGINSGVASVGSSKFESATRTRYTFTASGPVTNIAARIAATATDGAVLISQETARRLGDHFVVENLGDHVLKNVSLPTEIHSLIGLKPGPPPMPAAIRRPSGSAPRID